MPNGKAGDHPLTDLLTHGLPVFSPRVDRLVREIAQLRQQQMLNELDRLIANVDPRDETQVDALERRLLAVRATIDATKS